MPAVIEVDDLVVDRGSTRAVAGIRLQVGEGEVVALLGPNGAGKTTTVETIEGYHRPTSGRVAVLGLDPVADHRALRSRIGVMLQQPGVWPGMGPAEALRLYARYYPDPVDPDELLTTVDLTGVARTPWRQLSGGEQQRLSLALALVGRPEVAILDEPTAGVDPRGRHGIRAVVARMRDEGVGVLVTTHELTEAERMADRLVIIDRGVIVAVGTPAELASGAGAGEQVRFAARRGLDVAALSAAVATPVTEERPGEYLVAAPGSPQLVAAITGWLAERDVPLGDLRAGRESLEDVFLRLTSPPEPSASPVSSRAGGRRRRGRS